MDSDGNHDPTLLPLMVRCVEYFDVVIGSRYVLGGGMLTSRFRYWGSYAFNIVIRVVLGLRIHDNLSGVGPTAHERYSYCGDSIHLYTH